MIRVAISVEGQTEFEFCNKILTPHLRNNGIELIPIIITTKRKKRGEKFKGGGINLDRLKNEISKLLPNFDYVTTFYDLYGFDIKGKYSSDELEENVSSLFNNSNFIPYIQQYEFETLLFSNPAYYEEYFGDVSAKDYIKKIVDSFNGDIEKINDSQETAPSKRMITFFKEYNEHYDKIFHGTSILSGIGLDVVRKKCNRFNLWLTKLENLK